MTDYNLPTNCPICSSAFIENKAWDNINIFGCYYSNNGSHNYSLQIQTVKEQGIIMRNICESFSFAPYVVENTYIELLQKKINCCSRIFKNDYIATGIVFDFLIDPKNITLEKLKSYLMLI